MSTRRPNFLIFVTDQQRADHLGCYGNTQVRTPHIDGIAARGTVFEQCYVASPACMPNRAAIMTGRMPGTAGARMNGVPLPLDSRTFADALREAGWRTALIGKSHLQNMTDVQPSWRKGEGADRPQARREDRDSPAYEQESVVRWRDPDHAVRLPYYGFDHTELCLEHGDEVGGAYDRWLLARCPEAETLRGPDHALPGGQTAAPQAWRTALPEDLYPSAFVRDRAIDWLEDHAARGDQPFLLACSFPDPHHPFTPPGRYWDMYRPEDIELPATCGPATPADTPLKRALHEELAAGRRSTAGSRVIAVTQDEARAAIALNYGAITCIDDMVGAILAKLEALELARDTVVLFLSDHGDFMGDHGLLFKGPLHYRSVIRMPLIWADPQAGAGGRRTDLASAIDIGPSILARAGLVPPHGTQGRDLAPAAAPAAPRASVLVEEEGHRPMPGSGLPKVRTLVTGHWRLSVHAFEEWGELYDLRDDPDESVNRWDDPACATVRAELMLELVRAMARHADECPLPARMA